MAVSKSHCDKIAQPDGLTLLAIRSEERRKSPERAHLANAGEFNRRYLMGCQTSQYCIPLIWSVPLFMWSTSLNFKWSTLDFLYAQLDFLYGQPDFNMVNY